MKVSLTLTSYAALSLSVYFTDLSEMRLKRGSKCHILYFSLTELMKALRITSEMTKIVFFKALL